MLQRMLAIPIGDRHWGCYPRFAPLREPWFVSRIEEWGE